MIPLHICDAAQISTTDVNATIVLAAPVVLIGDVDPATGARAFLTIDEDIVTPIFSVVADAVTVRDLQITFFDVLFRVDAGGFLVLQHTSCWFGDTCIDVAPSALGLSVDHGYFMDTAVGILYEAVGSSATVVCTDCRFVDQRSAGILSQTPSTDAYANIVVADPVFVNVLTPFGTRSSATSTIGIAAVTEDFIHDADMINAQTYTMKFDTFSSGKNAADPAGHACKDSCRTQTILTGALFGAIMLLVLAAAVSFVYNNGKRTSSSTTAKKSWMSTTL
jgi:hypothetical protein